MECPICLNVYDTETRRPHVLPCGHSFCFDCVTAMEKESKLLCSICRIEHTIPETGHFPVNFHLEEIIMKGREAQSTSQKGFRNPIHTLNELRDAIRRCHKLQTSLVKRANQCTAWQKQQEQRNILLQQLLTGVERAMQANQAFKEAVNTDAAQIAEQEEKMRQKEERLSDIEENIETFILKKGERDAMIELNSLIHEQKETEVECQSVMEDERAVVAITQANLAVDSVLKVTEAVRDVHGLTAADGSDQDKPKSMLSPDIDVKRLRDVCECRMCLSFYSESKQPCALPCGHAFCRPCVNSANVNGVITCSLCGREHAVPRCERLPPCFAFDVVIELLRDAKLISEDEETTTLTKPTFPSLESLDDGIEKIKLGTESTSSEETDPDDAAEIRSSPSASASGINDRTPTFMNLSKTIPRHQALKFLRSMTSTSPVFASHAIKGRQWYSRIENDKNSLTLHAFKRQSLPIGAKVTKMKDLLKHSSIREVFLDLEWPGSEGRRRITIYLCRSHCEQFLLLATGLSGRSYIGTRMFNGEMFPNGSFMLSGGDYEYNNGEGGAAMLCPLEFRFHNWSPIFIRKDLFVFRISGDESKAAQFCITNSILSVHLPFGWVIEGDDTLIDAIGCRPITEVTVVDCGVVFRDWYGATTTNQ